MKFAGQQTMSEVLESLGLTTLQVTLYLTSFQGGPLSVLELSRITKVSRQQIYQAAEQLVDLGIFQPTNKSRRKYVAAQPQKLVTLGQQRVDQANRILQKVSDILPQLQGTASTKEIKAVIKYFEGLPKIKEAYQEELIRAKGTLVLSLAGSLDAIFEFFPETFWDTWNKKFVKQGSTSQMLAHYSPASLASAKCDRLYKRQTRFLSQFPLKVNIDVFNDVVLIVSFYDGVAIWIESRMIAESYRILFQTLWAVAQPAQ